MLGFTQQDADDVREVVGMIKRIDKVPLESRLEDLADRLEREANRYVIVESSEKQDKDDELKQRIAQTDREQADGTH